jgi:hypothetical protein
MTVARNTYLFIMRLAESVAFLRKRRQNHFTPLCRADRIGRVQVAWRSGHFPARASTPTQKQLSLSKGGATWLIPDVVLRRALQPERTKI